MLAGVIDGQRPSMQEMPRACAESDPTEKKCRQADKNRCTVAASSGLQGQTLPGQPISSVSREWSLENKANGRNRQILGLVKFFYPLGRTATGRPPPGAVDYHLNNRFAMSRPKEGHCVTANTEGGVSLVNLDRLFKLRLIVARFGEKDNASWWKTDGLLGPLGASVMKRGFPRTHRFAQARAVF